MGFASRKLLAKSKSVEVAPPTSGDLYWGDAVLLLHADKSNNQTNNSFLDSANNFTITRNGTPTQGSFTPFLNNYIYDPLIHGGSGYFPGVNSNYLSVPSNAAFNFASGTFTVEAWVMFTSTAATQQFILNNYNSTATGWYLQAYLNNFIVGFTGDGTDIQGTTTIVPNVWYHVAVSGSAGSYKLFVNGTQEGATYTGATSLAGGNLGIGAIGDRSGWIGLDPLNGYISNLRIVNGAALYTSNFTPPTSPVTLTSNGGATPSTAPTSGQVSLLCNFTNAGIFDSTKKNNLITVGDAKVSTSVVKYGTGSMYFSSVNEKLTLPTTAVGSALDYGTGSFTIECWYNYASGGGFIITQTVVSNNNLVFIVDSSRAIGVWLGNSNLGTSSAGVVPLNTWCHIALVRNGSSVVVYVNGSSVFTATNSSSIGGSMVPCINGYGHAAGFGNVCYIDDLRITKGVARYTSNFTPPGPLPDGPLTTLATTLELNDFSGYIVQEDSSYILLDT